MRRNEYFFLILIIVLVLELILVIIFVFCLFYPLVYPLQFLQLQGGFFPDVQCAAFLGMGGLVDLLLRYRAENNPILQIAIFFGLAGEFYVSANPHLFFVRKLDPIAFCVIILSDEVFQMCLWIPLSAFLFWNVGVYLITRGDHNESGDSPFTLLEPVWFRMTTAALSAFANSLTGSPFSCSRVLAVSTIVLFSLSDDP